jgi:hypothetical protein
MICDIIYFYLSIELLRKFFENTPDSQYNKDYVKVKLAKLA